MKIKSCKHCGEQFNLHSQRKQEVGGYINECPDCVEELETETKEVIRAFTTGDGKMASIQILKFEDKEQASLYKKVGINGADGTTVARGLSTMCGSPRLVRTAETPITRVSHEDRSRRSSKACPLGLYRCRPIRRKRLHRSPYLVRPK